VLDGEHHHERGRRHADLATRDPPRGDAKHHPVASLSQELGRSPTIAELAADTGAPEEQVLEALEAGQSYRSKSLDSTDSDDEGLGSRLGAEAQGMGTVELRATLEPHVRALPEREQSILRLRFVAGLTQSEIASALGISQMHVSRLLANSLTTLRARCGEIGELP